MTIEVKAPDGGVIRFPAGTTDDVISGVMSREYPAAQPRKGSVQAIPDGIVDSVLGPGQTDEERARYFTQNPDVPLPLNEWLFGGPAFDARRKAELERAQQGVGDIGRGMNRGATLNNAEEIVAWLRSKFGDEAYEAALADENAQTEEWKKRVGLGGQIATEATGSLVLPARAAVAGYHLLAPVGSNIMRRGAALAATSAPINAASVYGDMENKDIPTAATVGVATSAAFAPIAQVGFALGRAGTYLATEPFARLAEWMNLRAGRAVQPGSTTQRYAVGRMADAAEDGGVRTTADLNASMAMSEVPHTDMALVNAGNDRLSQLALEQARMLTRPAIAHELPGGRVVNENIFENLQHNQATNALGVPQAEALATRIQNDFNIPVRERNPVNVETRTNAEIERQGNRIADLRTPVMGQQVADTPLPGFVAALESDPAAADAYRRATRGVSLPGQTQVPRDLLPLHGREYERALHQWETRRDAALAAGRPFTDPPPVQLTDNNVPQSVLQNMMADASARTQSDDAIQRNLGINLHRVLTDLTERNPLHIPGRQLREANREIGVARTAQEDLTAGRRMPTQDPVPLNAALAEHPTLPPERQTNRRRGYVQGIVDQVNANSDNIGSIPGTILTDPSRVRAYDTVARAGTAAPTAEALARELTNVGRMQDTSEGLLAASRGREPGGSLTEQVARAYAGWNFSPTVGITRIVADAYNGMTQARRGEIARLLVDTSGEGRALLERELTRRVNGYGSMPSDQRRAVILEMSRQLSDGTADVFDVGRE